MQKHGFIAVIKRHPNHSITLQYYPLTLSLFGCMLRFVDRLDYRETGDRISSNLLFSKFLLSILHDVGLEMNYSQPETLKIKTNILFQTWEPCTSRIFKQVVKILIFQDHAAFCFVS